MIFEGVWRFSSHGGLGPPAPAFARLRPKICDSLEPLKTSLLGNSKLGNSMPAGLEATGPATIDLAWLAGLGASWMAGFASWMGGMEDWGICICNLTRSTLQEVGGQG